MKQLNSSLEVIDKVLVTMNEIGQSGYTSREYIFSNDTLKAISEFDREVIIKKLLKDDLIATRPSMQSVDKFPDGWPLYLITFEGVMHIANKGYSGKKKGTTF